MLRIHVDFNSMTKDGEKVWINTTVDDFLLPSLYEGLRVIVYEPDDFQVEATIVVEKDKNGNDWWYGILDWSTRRELSTEENQH